MDEVETRRRIRELTARRRRAAAAADHDDAAREAVAECDHELEALGVVRVQPPAEVAPVQGPEWHR